MIFILSLHLDWASIHTKQHSEAQTMAFDLILRINITIFKKTTTSNLVLTFSWEKQQKGVFGLFFLLAHHANNTILTLLLFFFFFSLFLALRAHTDQIEPVPDIREYLMSLRALSDDELNE